MSTARRKLVMALSLLSSLWEPAGLSAQRLPPEAGEGRRLAQTLCMSCHVVAPGQTGNAIAGVPSFMAIANHAGQTPERLAGAIILPHPPMPGIALTTAELRNVIAYILSLKTPG